MPPVSQAQRAAMFAAKAGHSTLGIPQKVGAEFANADPGGHLPAHASSSLEAMTGMPSGKKKVRRGGGRHKAKKSSAHDHLANLKQHMASGNHAAAKSSALMLANALHASMKPKAPQAPQMPDDSGVGM